MAPKKRVPMQIAKALLSARTAGREEGLEEAATLMFQECGQEGEHGKCLPSDRAKAIRQLKREEG